jgi:hypothetical protein
MEGKVLTQENYINNRNMQVDIHCAKKQSFVEFESTRCHKVTPRRLTSALTTV